MQLAAVTGSTTLLAAWTWTILNVVGMARRISRGGGCGLNGYGSRQDSQRIRPGPCGGIGDKADAFVRAKNTRTLADPTNTRVLGAEKIVWGNAPPDPVDDPYRWRVHTDSGMIHSTAPGCWAVRSAGCGSVGLGRG